MNTFSLFATPWWVNLLIAVPIAAYYFFGKDRLAINKKGLVVMAVFGAAFGFVEAAVVVYLRAALGMLPGLVNTSPTQLLAGLSNQLFVTEFFREAATMVMLAGVAFLVGRTAKERFAAFLWTFAFWDIFYYLWLQLLIGWPGSLTTPDVLFLIPTPWLAQVWFPLLVSSLVILVVWLRA